MVKVLPLAVPQLAPCAPSGRAWRLWAAQHSRAGPRPLGPQPRPQLLERAVDKVAHFTAFEPWLLHHLSARLAAPCSAALPEGGPATGRAATASRARASGLQRTLADFTAV